MLIVFSGKARSGKDSAAKYLKRMLIDKYSVKFNTRAYADDLKERLLRDFDLSYEQVYGDLKEVQDPRYPKKTGEGYWTPRELMQFVGTDVYRMIFSEFWVKQLKDYIATHKGNYIITDGRFPDEIDWVIDSGGIHIRVVRENEVKINNMGHDSETSLDDMDISDNHYIVYNNGKNLDGFFKEIDKVVIPALQGLLVLKT